MKDIVREIQIALVSLIVGSIFGAAFHDFYTGMVKEKIWNEAVERGYATKVTTSEGEAFMWKGEDK